MLIAVINQSTLVTNEQVIDMCNAIQIQLDLHVLPAWYIKSATIKFYKDAASAPGYSWIVSILDNSTQAGALGYHSEDGDKVDAFVFATPVLQSGGVVLYDAVNPSNVSVSSVLSHEICEMVGDRFANFWCDGPNVVASDGHTYNEYALELCDPVEGDVYQIGLGGLEVSVSNFIFPSWFNPEATVALNAPFDFLRKLTKPFTMTPGGYLIVRQGGKTNQVFGKDVAPHKKVHVGSKWYRR